MGIFDFFKKKITPKESTRSQILGLTKKETEKIKVAAQQKWEQSV